MKWSSVLLVLMLFFGCTDRNKENTNHDKISELLVKATDRNLYYNERRNISLQTLKILSAQKNDSVNRLQLNKLSYNFIVINDWNNFLITNKIAFERAFNSNDLMQIGLCKNYKGIYFENISNNDSAYYYYLKSEKIFI
jgi:hypothetical protein